ncbi:MAG: peroxidase family protein [Gammaproteobacteria bacterium]
MMRRKGRCIFGSVAVVLGAWAGAAAADTLPQRLDALRDCAQVVREGFRPIAKERSERFLGKVQKETANCRGGQKALKYRGTPWVDWQNYWATGDETTKTQAREPLTALGRHLKANGRGIDGALIDLEYQRVELVTFNLFDNKTYEAYVKGRGDVQGPALKEWTEMRLPQDHPDYREVGGDGEQLCKGQLIRHRNLTGICNDLKNPLMGSTNTPFARNVQFETTFPDLGKTELVRNRHGDRLSMLKPDPQVISRKLFTRTQSQPEKCKEGKGLPGFAKDARCDYKPAPFFNVLAAFWIQFMTHDWFSHLREGHNDAAMVGMGCATQRVNNEEKPLSKEDIEKLKCRPEDKIDASYYAESAEPRKFSHQGKEYLARAHKTTANTVTAWWDASQIYGYDETSRRRVKRDPNDAAKLLMSRSGDREGQGEKYGYLPLFKACPAAAHDCVPDPIHPVWAGQEATAFPDNWTIGMSFYHNVFAREHNRFVEEFRKRAAATPDGDCGVRNPDQPDKIIRYKDLTPDELFEVARLVVAAEIAKIHTIEWTTQLLYGEPLYLGMNSNWFGLLRDHKLVADALERVVGRLARTSDPKKRNAMYSVFASGPGIFGLGNRVTKSKVSKQDIWDLENPDHVNSGINHFGSPFNFPEEFTTVYRLHTMVPDLIEYREWGNTPNSIRYKVPVVETFRGKATPEMHQRGLANWAISMGRQRLGLLWLQNHAQFLQNVPMDKRLGMGTKIDVPALDLIRDRERGVPRFNEFRRQYGLKTLTGFDDFIDQHEPPGSSAREEQQALVKALREVYGQHRCDASKVITDAQVNADGSPINDCLGHPDGSMVDNVEDVDTVVGWLAERTRPHGFAISETQFQVFILNASRRLFSDRFFTSSFRPEFYSHLGVAWVNDNGPNGKVWEKGEPNDHRQEVSPLKRVLLRTMPELTEELEPVVNAFDPWARDRGRYYSLQWKPRAGAEADEAF